MPAERVSRVCTLYYTILASYVVSRAASDSTCLSPTVSGDTSYKWPTQNPMLVAPAVLNYSYNTYNQPLICEHTGKALSIPVPVDFPGTFTLVENISAASATGTFIPETYVLRSMEIRKPGKNYDGTHQVLAHSLELALVHQQEGGAGYWANVIIPFEVSGESSYDMLAPIVAGATLPDEEGNREPVLLSSAQVLDLERGFLDGTFMNFWTTLPTDCSGVTVPARQFMRTAVLNTGEGTFSTLMDALNSIPDYPPIQSPDAAWITNSCPTNGGACTKVEVQDLQAQYDEALVLQSEATIELRSRKDLMDQAYYDLGNETEGSLERAISARNDLSTAEQEMLSVADYTNELEGFLNESHSNVWNADAPAGPDIDNFTIGALSMLDLAAARAFAGGSLVGGSVVRQHNTINNVRQDCSAYKMSPIDIDTQRVMDPTAISQVLAQPLQFKAAALSLQGVAHIQQSREFLRLQAPGSLGSLKFLGELKDISYVDVRVPSEHAVNGRRSAAELQFVHIPPTQQERAPAVAVSVLLDIKQEENTWLTPLLEAAHSGKETSSLRSLMELHSAMAAGKTDRYFRYDGTTTTFPCRGAAWFVLEEPGHISEQQLEALRLITLPTLSPRFKPSLVARGTQKLLTRVGAKGILPSAGLVSAPPRRSPLPSPAQQSGRRAPTPAPAPAPPALRARRAPAQQRLRI